MPAKKSFPCYGLVLRETPVKDADKFLTVMSDNRGKISVYAYGARAWKNTIFGAAQLGVYSEMVIEQKGDFLTLKEASILDSFSNIRTDLLKSALTQYLCDLTCEVSPEEVRETGTMSLILNALFCLSKTDKDHRLIKGAFEMRLMCEAGFQPQLNICDGCGKTEIGTAYFDMENGCAICPDCYSTFTPEQLYYEDGRLKPIKPVSPAVLEALRYITSADGKKVFSFRIDEALFPEFSAICESYCLYQVDRKFKTLDFYKNCAI
ncbi:MAG: DNA repair protein RecO [Clostridiales bacterium]|nr:DNA repair protein RecO [Clostridiales bacterium]